MSDRISNNMMAYVGDTPWHGKGHHLTAEEITRRLAAGETLTQIWLSTAKMDWKVERRMLAMRPGPLSPDFQQLGNNQSMLTDPLKGFRAIVRADTDEVFQVSTVRYHPIQNIQVVDFFQQFCEAGHGTMETLIGINGGRIIVALVRLNGIEEIGKGDKVASFLTLATSHDGSLRTIAKPTQVRIVCWNTLCAALGLGSGKLGEKEQREFRLKHSAKWTQDRADEAKRVMGMAVEQVKRVNEVARELAKVTIDEKGREEFVTRLLKGESLLDQAMANTTGAGTAGLLDAIVEDQGNGNAHTDGSNGTEGLKRLGKAILESILESPGSDLPGAKGTLWGAVNGVTHYVDHVRGRSDDTRMAAAWFGPGDALKTQAVRVAANMAGLKLATAGEEVRN